MRTESFATPGHVRLRINIPAGSVEVETAETGETTIEVEANGRNAAEAEQEVTLELRRRGEGHEVVVDADDIGGLFRNASFSIRIVAPHGVDLETNLASADLRGRGRYGDVEVNIASGDVALEQVASAEVNSASGDVVIDHAAAGIEVNTASGDVDLRRVREGEVKVQSASGDVAVGIAAGSRLWVDAQSLAGETTSELDLEAGPSGGDDGPLIELRVQTMSGDIAVRRA